MIGDIRQNVTDEMVELFECDEPVVAPHMHDFLELAYVWEGEAVHKINGANAVKIRTGDYFIIDYKTEHEYFSRDGHFVMLNCLFLPQLLDKSLLYCRDFKTLLSHYMLRLNYDDVNFKMENRVFHDDDLEVRGLLERMLKEYGERRLGWREMLRVNLIGIIITAARNISSERGEGGIIRCIENEIHRNYDKKTGLSDFAERWNYSLPYLSKRFKTETGVTYSEYVMRTRVNEACRLLVNTDKKIAEISGLVGYGDVDFFCRVFKKHTGVTPKAFRRAVDK